MAERLATQYVHTHLELSEQELTHLFAIVHTYGLLCYVDVQDSGDCNVVIEQHDQSRSAFQFCKVAGKLVFQGTQCLHDTRIAQAWRTIIARFRGDATVHRVYEAYTLEYVYSAGRVLRITEITPEGRKLIYCSQGTMDVHALMMASTTVEQHIEAIRKRIDAVLDERNQTIDLRQRAHLDEQLKKYAHLLFICEA